MCLASRVGIALMLLVPGTASATALCEEVRFAVQDARKLPKEQARYWRYLTTYNLQPKERELVERVVILYHLNCLSHEPDIARPVKVTASLYRINVLYYGEAFTKAYEKLAVTNPYFPCFERTQVVPVVPTKVVPLVQAVERPAKVWVIRDGLKHVDRAEVRPGEKTYLRTGDNSYEEEKAAPPQAPVGPQAIEQVDAKDIKIAAFLPAEEMVELANLTQSKAPLLRADFVFYRTSVSDNGEGDGYYDFHGLKTRDDAYKLAGLDLATVARLRLDRAAMVGRSDVAVNKIRQVWWVKSYAGSWWQTFDINKKGKADRNLLVLLGQSLDKVDFKHDAEEIYSHLSNGLWFVLASDDKGLLQNTVPDTVAKDKVSTDNDGRIRNCLSCFRCHEDGLKPIADWGREAFRVAEDFARQGQTALGSADPKQYLRIKQLYLSNLDEKFQADQLAFAAKVKEINGMKPGEVAAGISKVWNGYYNDELGMKELAAELGVVEKDWRDALVSYLDDRTRRGEVNDTVLAALVAPKPQKMIRDHVEERFAIMQLIYGEWKNRRKP